MKFGFNSYKKLTGAEVFVRAAQLLSLLPVVYIFLISGYPALITRQSFASFLFDFGVSTMPRVFVLGLSAFFKLTKSEIALNFALLIPMLAFGLVMGKLLRGKRKKVFTTRIVLAVWLFADLVIRVLPFRFNAAFGLVPAILGAAVRVCYLVFVCLDIYFGRKEETA